MIEKVVGGDHLCGVRLGGEYLVIHGGHCSGGHDSRM